jgi:cell division protease FtsH
MQYAAGSLNMHILVKSNDRSKRYGCIGLCAIHAKEQYLYNTDQLIDQICMTLGGRASEEIFFHKISTGASNDLQQITRMAYSMITVYGMNEKVGNISFYDPTQENTFTKPYSEETGKLIDEEVRKLIDGAYIRTKALLTERKVEVRKIGAGTIEKRSVVPERCGSADRQTSVSKKRNYWM